MLRRPNLFALAFVSLPFLAVAEETQKAMFALVVGVNQGVDQEFAPLHYADDDAARYFDLFRFLGARTYVLARLDENTLRLHAQAGAEAQQPTQESLKEVVGSLATDIQLARGRGVETVFYFIYAGHGNIKNGEGYLTLQDARLTAKRIIEEVVKPVNADRSHLVVDACYSYFLAYSRGPGGNRRAVSGFSQIEALAQDDRVGLLLSTSSARESHEWEAFEAGVFSHEVRSGLYGAADADGDGRVSYRELAAFVERANAAIPNERFRSKVFARPPRNSELLLDLRSVLPRHLEVDGAKSAHYFLEDNRGVRLLDFHNGLGQATRILLPTGGGRMYLHSVVDDQEFSIPTGPEVVILAALEPQTPRARSRGAAHESFGLLFSLPFDRKVVDQFQYETALGPIDVSVELMRPPNWRRYVGWGALGAGSLTLAAGVATSLWARSIHDGVRPDESQVDVARRNERIGTRNQAAAILYAAGGGAVLAGLLILFWPDGYAGAYVSPSPDGTFLVFQKTFQ